ncbi:MULTISPECIES: hypothetical protein [unclassified Bradyrhizobium]|uniref:hypothetical protein n=1 Tax=unclassified Bradyrhizobium TaxID=2631580 RepID=UPI001FFAE9C4|nr:MULTISPECIES: hypothetical protein [unclassified Bradyrhizobium]MCK1437385.1 hypothetical protein [Bradyrhizobium sp. 15]MDE5463322.1 hypothetical protein [Bradyrhizobium sp. CSS354]
MSHDYRSTEDLMRIAAAGGGFSINGAPRSVQDLMRIAAAAGAKGSRVTFTGLGFMTAEDLMRIAAAGKGCVEFA